MSLYFDHVVVNVQNLDQAISDFEEAGFVVVRGGVHGGGLSENALIFFSDDTFIELFSLTKSIKVTIVRFLKKLKFFKRFQYSKKWGLAYRFYSRALELPEGIADICFLSGDYEKDWDRINGGGIFLSKTLIASRKRPNGKRSTWKMSAPFINDLPFLRSAYSPPAEIGQEHLAHPNGIIGIGEVTAIALDYKDMTSKYESFLGLTPQKSNDNKSQKSSFKLKDTTVELVKASDHKEIRDQLRSKGIGMYGLTFKYDPLKKKDFDKDRLRGLAVLE